MFWFFEGLWTHHDELWMFQEELWRETCVRVVDLGHTATLVPRQGNTVRTS